MSIDPQHFFRLYISVSGPTRPRRETRDRSKDLSKALTALAPDIDPAEAQLLSAPAHTTARSLAREYHVVLNPEFQAFLVNVGLRKRGWCGHWARDIGARLKEVKPRTLGFTGVLPTITRRARALGLFDEFNLNRSLSEEGPAGGLKPREVSGVPRPGRYYVGNSYFIGFYCNDLDKSNLYEYYSPVRPSVVGFSLQFVQLCESTYLHKMSYYKTLEVR